MNYLGKYVWSILILFEMIVTGCSKDPVDEYDPELPYKRPVTASSSKWIARIVEYNPAPGQFINTTQGNEAAAQSIVGKKGMVSLGSYGSNIIFQFDHTVLNRDGYDFVIHGNAGQNSSEPGIVMVALDRNGNGKPDPNEWYELPGADHTLLSTTKNYTITYYRPLQTEVAEDIRWTDDQGGSGAIHAAPVAEFHTQPFWPLFGIGANSQTLTFTGARLESPVTTEQDGHWTLGPVGAGYADNFSADYLESINGDRDTQYANKFDIGNAVDANGNPVALKGIDFIKVYTAVNREAGWLGEYSTEICGAVSLSVITP